MTDPSDNRFSRRALLEWSAASAALAACSRAPRRQIVPFASQPKDVRPGVPRKYATAHAIDGYAMGLVVESHDGRPTKVEGNPRHPASFGATRALDQALIASLYDPDRAAGIRGPGGPSTLEALRVAFAGKSRLAVLLEPTSSPSLAARVERLRARGAAIGFYAPLSKVNAWNAARLATGQVLETELAADHARAVLSLGADFLASGPWCVRDARALVAQRRRAGARVYVTESRRTPTGVFADHRVATTTRERALFARAVFADVLSSVEAPSPIRALAARFAADGAATPASRACAKDLVAAGRGAAVVVGDREPLELHLLAHALADALGAFGEAMLLRPSPVLEAGGPSFDLAAFAAAMTSADGVVVCGPNPVYSAHDVDFAQALGSRDSACVSIFEDETARACGWHAPLAHPLESWADLRAPDGALSIAQPLIDPLRAGITVAEVLDALLGDARDAHAITRDAFGRDERAWNDALEAGIVEGTATKPATAKLDADAVARALDAWKIPASEPIELALHESHAAYDGRFAGNAWLLELPEPITKLTWGNHAVVAPATAATFGAKEGDVVRVAGDRASIELSLAIDEGTAAGVVAIALGYGRTAVERLASNVGANAFVLASASGVRVTRTGRDGAAARTQNEFGLHDREHAIARMRDKSDAPLEEPEPRRLSMYAKPPTHGPHAWGMVVDLAACTACGACVVACQAENNVPVVGEKGVRDGRHMHWLRIDRYESRGRTVMQPMLCQHCDEAPCEYVCPVNATVHSSDGLNEMVYNRCVGTRFCSNNCPYKVRRFNWFNYHEDETAFAQLAHNPDVTVRARGVMEKCTFCVQRIRETEHQAMVERRALHHDEVNTACAQACPTGALVFGDVEDASSRVAIARRNAESYAALDELGTRPRVRYLPKITDRNKEIG